MAGPGGGSRGGGGGRGGSFGGGGGFGGGGRRGGGFGGPRGPMFRPRPMFGMGWGWGWRRGPYYYGGGGCLGGLLGMLMLPFLLVLLAIVLVISALGSSLMLLKDGGMVPYNEETFQDYANDQYYQAFGGQSGVEDNILIVFLTAENNYDYCYIGWVGDHVHGDVNYLFGAEGTALGNAISSSVPENYKYSLDSNLAMVTERMASAINRLQLRSNFRCDESHGAAQSKLINHSALPITGETVNMALEQFTEETGISIAIVVDEMEDVFGKSMPTSAIITLVIAGAVVIFAGYMVIRAIIQKKKNPGGTPPSGQNQQNQQPQW